MVVHAARRSDLSAGQTILIFGVGAIGLLACAVAKSMGAALVVAIDVNQTRLDFAKSNGFASQIFCLPTADNAKTTTEQLEWAQENSQTALAVFNKQEGFDLVFECTGAEPCIQMSMHVGDLHLTMIVSCVVNLKLLLPSPDGNRWWQGDARWNGFRQRHPSLTYCRSPRGRHPGLLPLR